MRLTASLAVVCLLAANSAAADDRTGHPPAASLPAVPVVPLPTGSANGESPDEGDEVARRRLLLGLHQFGGMMNLTAMTATAVLGQLHYNDMYGEGATRSGRFRTFHRAGAVISAVGFAAVASMAVLAPQPYQLEGRGLDAMTLHKAAAIGAALTLAAQIAVGLAGASSSAESPARADLARAHLVLGYATVALMATAGSALLF